MNAHVDDNDYNYNVIEDSYFLCYDNYYNEWYYEIFEDDDDNDNSYDDGVVSLHVDWIWIKIPSS